MAGKSQSQAVVSLKNGKYIHILDGNKKNKWMDIALKWREKIHRKSVGLEFLKSLSAADA